MKSTSTQGNSTLEDDGEMLRSRLPIIDGIVRFFNRVGLCEVKQLED
jgi:hypothetical protein